MFWVLTPYHIYDLQTFSNFIFISIFYYSLCCLFTPDYHVLLHKSILVWYSPTCLFFSCCLSYLRNHCQDQHLKAFLFIFSINFIFWSLMFRSLIPLVFISVYGVGKGPVSFFCLWISSFPKIIYWRNDSFHWLVLAFCQGSFGIIWLCILRFIYGLSVLSCWSTCLSLCQHHAFDCCFV